MVHLSAGTLVTLRHRVCSSVCLENGGAEAAPVAQARRERAVKAAVAARAGNDASSRGGAAAAAGGGPAAASQDGAAAAAGRGRGPAMSTAYGPMRRHAAAKKARQLY